MKTVQPTLPNIMHQWFMYLFDVRAGTKDYVNCFECSTRLYKEQYRENTCCYSHLLEKSRYPKYAGDEENVVIVCPDCHALFTFKPKKAKNQYKKYLELKKTANEQSN